MRAPLSSKSVAVLLAGALSLRIASRLLLRKPTLNDAVVFITGGSRGLGLALALECTRRGARLAICGQDADALDRAAEILRTHGARVLAIPCDVRNREEIGAAIERASAVFGRIDALINNAGTIAVGPMDAMTVEDYRDAMDTHFWAMYYAVERILPVFQAQGGGRIANVTSIGGKISVPHLLPYCVSKFAAVGYSEGLRAALSRMNVSVTTVVPGLMRTGSPRNAWFKAQHRKEYTWFALSDALPFSSMAAHAAARQIVDGMLQGRAEIVLSLPAKFGVLLHGIAPGLVSNAMRVAALLLPGPGGVDTLRMRGSQSTTKLTESPLTLLTKRAERAYNQV